MTCLINNLYDKLYKSLASFRSMVIFVLLSHFFLFIRPSYPLVHLTWLFKSNGFHWRSLTWTVFFVDLLQWYSLWLPLWSLLWPPLWLLLWSCSRWVSAMWGGRELPSWVFCEFWFEKVRLKQWSFRLLVLCMLGQFLFFIQIA